MAEGIGRGVGATRDGIGSVSTHTDRGRWYMPEHASRCVKAVMQNPQAMAMCPSRARTLGIRLQ